MMSHDRLDLVLSFCSSHFPFARLCTNMLKYFQQVVVVLDLLFVTLAFAYYQIDTRLLTLEISHLSGAPCALIPA